MFAASIENGGLGFAPRFIGLVLGLQGIVTGVVQVFFFAPIHKRFGNKRTFVAGLTAYACLTLSLPVMNALARRGMMRTMWAVVGLHLLLSCPAFMSFSESLVASSRVAMSDGFIGCMFIFVTSAAPSKTSLGTLNGISQTTISIIRAIGPAAATSLFAVSIERHLLGGWFVYVVLTTVNIAGLTASRWLKEEKRAH
jgi:MFS family permease